MYQATRLSQSTFVPVRNLQYHVRQWGTPQPGEPPLVLLHGWMDVAASYQFVVDALPTLPCIWAPDWRGFGQTEVPDTDHFVFADYLADLDFLLDQLAPGQAVNLVGHSMGGNVAMAYAGVRPERVRRLVNLEGFGMPRTVPEQAPGRYARWIDELKALHQGQRSLRGYPDLAAVAQRLCKTNPRLPTDKAEWLARHWARPDADGNWFILGHAAHKLASANLYRVDEALALMRRISAPVLSVVASDNSMDQWWKGSYTPDEFMQRMQAVPTLQTARVEDAGHMLHHDQPQAVAALIAQFFA